MGSKDVCQETKGRGEDAWRLADDVDPSTTAVFGVFHGFTAEALFPFVESLRAAVSNHAPCMQMNLAGPITCVQACDTHTVPHT